MVKGLDVFRAWFKDHADQYILIGGTAATLTMEESGLAFRATKDLDIVLHVEALTPAFGQAFWKFIEAGGYVIRQASDTAKPIFYRFQKPTDAGFPAMVEETNGVKTNGVRSCIPASVSGVATRPTRCAVGSKRWRS
jgi:hypothetical protein